MRSAPGIHRQHFHAQPFSTLLFGIRGGAQAAPAQPRSLRIHQ